MCVQRKQFLTYMQSVNRRRTDDTLARRRTVKRERDKQRPSRISENKFPPSPLKLVVTVLKWNNIRLVCQTTQATLLCLAENVGGVCVCVCVCIVVSNIHCVVFLLCFISYCVPEVVSFSRLSFLDCPVWFSLKHHEQYYIEIHVQI
jgi:hypothetical protein